MGIEQSSIVRVYKCDNKECQTILSFQEKVEDDWQKLCPLCNQETLYLDSASLSVSCFTDMNKPKTLGMIGQNNQARREREEDKKKEKRPFWRDKKVNFNILKDPIKYVSTGKV